MTRQRNSPNSSVPMPPSTQAATIASRPRQRPGSGGIDHVESSRMSAAMACASARSLAST